MQRLEAFTQRFSQALGRNLTMEQREERHADADRKRALKLFSSAQELIEILAGDLNKGFYTHPDVLAALGKKVKSGVKLEIVFGPKANERSIQALKEATGGQAVLMEVAERPHHHFMVVDRKSALVENYHAPNVSLSARRIDEVSWFGAGSFSAIFLENRQRATVKV